jgi:hypothetical protein
LNFDPPDLCLRSSWDYRREPLVPCSPLLISSLCLDSACSELALRSGGLFTLGSNLALSYFQGSDSQLVVILLLNGTFDNVRRWL